jgi:cytochrome c oxidase subunit 2
MNGSMQVDVYERIWLWSAGGLIVLFLAAVGYAAMRQGAAPPSHVETIDPATVRDDPRFAEPGVAYHADGSVTITAIALTFGFQPGEIRVPAGRPVRFRLTSPDVVHGFQIVGTNANTMVVPGYVSQFSTVFPRPGRYLIVCNEYCGLGHHMMSGTLIVEDTP